MEQLVGDFTIPGESAFEELTLQLADLWGADVVRDSDGTTLSPRLLSSGMKVYSTVCVIRDHNDFINAHPEYQQQTVLESFPRTARGNSLDIELLSGYFIEQFELNTSDESVALWQVFDRTSNRELDLDEWSLDREHGIVTIKTATPYHNYSVDFLAWRIWEEISMYNHVTNSWNKEHLRQLDPRYPEVQSYLISWMRKWCEQHPHTDVVRFTSLFYNFVWIWRDSSVNRDVFTDWGSYDFTISPLALEQFKRKYGYSLFLEDFINQGRRNSSHCHQSSRIIDYMDFINEEVTSLAKELVDIVHSYNKEAYVFYDDSWVGMEPYGKRFSSIGFDGLIKCVFSGYEARLCAGVAGVKTHELRLHPYLFPTGLGGLPTFSEGGNPSLDARKYWVNIRKAIICQSIDRIGLGGYLHLTEKFPDFQHCIRDIADEFRKIKKIHSISKLQMFNTRILIVSQWGKLRSWTCGGHYHEHPDLDLLNILESLSGLPFNVDFAAFDELDDKKLSSYDVVINAGTEHSSWSGAACWNDRVVELLSSWVDKGGCLIVVNEGSRLEGYSTELRMANVLGVDLVDDRRLCEGRWPVVESSHPIAFDSDIKGRVNIIDPSVEVLRTKDTSIQASAHVFGNGTGVYLSSFRTGAQNTKALTEIILRYSKKKETLSCITSNPAVSIYSFEESGIVIAVNDSQEKQEFFFSSTLYTLSPFEMKELTLKS